MGWHRGRQVLWTAVVVVGFREEVGWECCMSSDRDYDRER